MTSQRMSVSHLEGAASYQTHSHSWGKKKNIRYYTTHTHTCNKAYLASTVCHGQHDVLVSNGCCIRLGNKTEQTRAVSDAMRASNFHSFFVLSSPSLPSQTQR